MSVSLCKLDVGQYHLRRSASSQQTSWSLVTWHVTPNDGTLVRAQVGQLLGVSNRSGGDTAAKQECQGSSAGNASILWHFLGSEWPHIEASFLEDASLEQHGRDAKWSGNAYSSLTTDGILGSLLEKHGSGLLVHAFSLGWVKREVVLLHLGILFY